MPEVSYPKPNPEKSIDLGEEGLSDGDVIDPYFDDYFKDGNDVTIPEGNYQWKGTGLGGTYKKDTSLMGEGTVILEAVDHHYREAVTAEGCTVRIGGMTVTGKVEGSRMREQCDEDGTIIIDSWHFPDGCDDGVRSRPHYVPGDHAGTVYFVNSYMHGFDDNGIYATSPGKGEGGRVIIDNCFAHNCNVAGFRIGGRGSIIRNSVVLNDAPAPLTSNGSRNQRGIRIGNYEHSQDMLIENVDIVHEDADLGGGVPIRWSKDSPLSHGTMRNIRIRNEKDNYAIEDSSRAEGWEGHNIHVTGSGDLTVPDWFENVCQGEGCDEPSVQWSSDNYNEAPEVEDPTEGKHVLQVLSRQSGDVFYSFVYDGNVEGYAYKDRIQGGSNDTIIEQDDGTTLVEGKTGNEYGDAFLVDDDGELLDFKLIEPDTYDLELILNNKTYVPSDFEAPDDGSDGDETDDSSGTYDEGYNAGYEDGLVDGEKNADFDAVYQDGYDDGYAEAQSELDTDGAFDEGYEQGRNDGYTEGYETGYQDAEADSGTVDVKQQVIEALHEVLPDYYVGMKSLNLNRKEEE